MERAGGQHCQQRRREKWLLQGSKLAGPSIHQNRMRDSGTRTFQMNAASRPVVLSMSRAAVVHQQSAAAAGCREAAGDLHRVRDCTIDSTFHPDHRAVTSADSCTSIAFLLRVVAPSLLCSACTLPASHSPYHSITAAHCLFVHCYAKMAARLLAGQLCSIAPFVSFLPFPLPTD